MSPQRSFERSPLQLRTKPVSSLLLGVALLIAGATALSSYKILHDLILNNLRKEAQANVRQAADEIDSWLATLKDRATTLANNPSVRSLNWAIAEPYLQLEVERLPGTALQIARPDGSYYSTRFGFAKDKNVKDRPYFQQGMAGEVVVTDPVIGKNTGKRNAHVAAPIWSIPPLEEQLSPEQAEIRARSLAFFKLPTDPNQRPQVVGVLSLSIGVVKVSEIVEHLTQDQGSYAFAIDSQGTAIAHPDQQLLAKSQSLLKSEDSSLVSVVQAMLKRQPGVQLTQLNGQSVYVAYLPLKQADWSIALVTPQANLEQQLRVLNLLAAVVGGLLALAVFLILRQVRLFAQTHADAQQQALLNRLTERIRQSLDLNTILQTAVEEVAKVLQLNHVSFGWYYPIQQRLEVVSEYHQTNLLADVKELDMSSLGRLKAAFSQHQLISIQNTAKDPNLDDSARQALLQLEAVAYLALPVLDLGSDLPGYLICKDTQPRRWSRDEMDLLQAVVDQLAIALKQSRLYAQTQQQVQLLSQQSQQLSQTLQELQATQTQLVQTEKMSSLGQLVAGVAHEINNPVNFIHGNLQHASGYITDVLQLLELYQVQFPQATPEIQEQTEAADVDFIKQDLPKLLSSMQVGTERIRGIVQSLRTFSRLDEAEMKAVDIHEGIESTLLILGHRIKAGPNRVAIQVVKQYGNLPQVECYAGQLNQVFLNIITNGIDALEETLSQPETKRPDWQPTITIQTEQTEAGMAVVRIRDNGPGMPEVVQQQLFNPFFTTKPVGQGTGLGMSISYQIVTEKHGGRLLCHSTLESGTEFLIQIPLQQHSWKPSITEPVSMSQA